MSAHILRFPARGPFAIRVEREGAAWLVVCRSHGWLYGTMCEAVGEARALACGFGVAIEVQS